MKITQNSRPVRVTVFVMVKLAMESPIAMGWSTLKLTMLAQAYNVMNNRKEYVRMRDRIDAVNECEEN